MHTFPSTTTPGFLLYMFWIRMINRSITKQLSFGQCCLCLRGTYSAVCPYTIFDLILLHVIGPEVQVSDPKATLLTPQSSYVNIPHSTQAHFQLTDSWLHTFHTRWIHLELHPNPNTSMPALCVHVERSNVTGSSLATTVRNPKPSVVIRILLQREDRGKQERIVSLLPELVNMKIYYGNTISSSTRTAVTALGFRGIKQEESHPLKAMFWWVRSQPGSSKPNVEKGKASLSFPMKRWWMLIRKQEPYGPHWIPRWEDILYKITVL